MTKKQILNLKLEEITTIYKGKRNCCRCGCGGEYVSTSYMKNPRSEVDNKKALKLLNRAKSLVKKGASYECSETFKPCWIDIETGKDKSITLYFDE